MVVNKEKNMLLSSSYDGRLGVFDLRQGLNREKKLYALSDCLEEDLLGVQIVKDGRFVLCSTNMGTIFIFKWDHFGDCSDIIRGPKTSIDSILAIDQNTLLTGSEDGYLRAISIYPNSTLNILGKHSDDEYSYPIFKLAQAHCKQIIATTSNDSSIQFYEIHDFLKSRNNLSIHASDETPNQLLINQRKLKNMQDK